MLLRLHLFLFLLLVLYNSLIHATLPSPENGKFSENVLSKFINDSFEFQAFDIKRNDALSSFVVSARVKSSTGVAPDGVKDAPDIAALPPSKLAGVFTGLVILIRDNEAFGRFSWAYRIFVLPKDAPVRVDVNVGGQVFVTGATVTTDSNYRRSFASFSAHGRLMYSAIYGNSNAIYTDLAISNSDLGVNAIYEESQASGKTVSMDRLIMSTGIKRSTVQLTPSNLTSGRVIKDERADSVKVVFSRGVTRCLVLVRRQTAHKEDYDYRTEDRLCSISKVGANPIACFAQPVDSMFAAPARFALSSEYAYFTQFKSSGVLETVNITRLDVNTLKPSLGDWGGKPGILELPPAEGAGARSRSNLAALSVFADKDVGVETVRVLLSTAGTVNESIAAPKEARGRVAVVDFLPNGKVGAAFLDLSQQKPVLASSIAALKRGTDQDAVALGTIVKSIRGSTTGQMYLAVFGDPLKGTRGGTTIVKNSRNNDCIGHDSHLNGIPMVDVLRSKRGVRIQLHPLRFWSYQLVPMLCFENTGSRLCATHRHVIIHHGYPKFMKDLCTERGDCFSRAQRPFNFKGSCGSVVHLGNGIGLSMHAADYPHLTAHEAVEQECALRQKSFARWFLRTL